MGQNSTEVAYGFGQMGSVYCDVDNVIIPPKDHVIVAIQFLESNTPTVLTPEKLDEGGPNFPAITDSTDQHVDAAGNNYFNFNGVWASEVADVSVTAGNDITLETPAVPTSRIKVGNYVLLVNGDASEADTDMVIDAETPYPIYSGPNKQGVQVTAYDGVSKVQLDADITPTIYGRWVAFKGENAKGVICYFGK